MSERRILVTGGSGQVGKELLRTSWPQGTLLVAPTRAELDLADYDWVSQYVARGGFDAIVNSGAYTAVDSAETEVLQAWKVNALAPAAIASAAANLNIPIIQVSTDYVFNGLKDQPYNEDDAVGPLGVYGASKEAGEQAIRTLNHRHIILRTAWVFSANGSNFVDTMLRLAADRDVLNVVSDQNGSPTSAVDIAAAIAAIVARLFVDPAAPLGTYNFVNDGQSTWYGFAQEIFSLRAQSGYTVPIVNPILSSQYATKAKRPHNSRLSTAKLARDYGIYPRPWTDALADVMDAIQCKIVSEASAH
ncbi:MULTISPECIES: dTDP-4-dehydrorhamnose reductase [unclassified Ensifer]|uniref:dTDP-4-dehydrorhamnose reductase n=1 Tax=unclassified Ensifer TaxID=2633371 RepID=UPI00300FBD47